MTDFAWLRYKGRRRLISLKEPSPLAVASTETEETQELSCPECGGQVRWDLDCPRWKNSQGRLMACMGCGNAVRFECARPDEDGDLLEDGCGWWFQYPLHPESSQYASMGREPAWDYKKYRI